MAGEFICPDTGRACALPYCQIANMSVQSGGIYSERFGDKTFGELPPEITEVLAETGCLELRADGLLRLQALGTVRHEVASEAETIALGLLMMRGSEVEQEAPSF